MTMVLGAPATAYTGPADRWSSLAGQIGQTFGIGRSGAVGSRAHGGRSDGRPDPGELVDHAYRLARTLREAAFRNGDAVCFIGSTASTLDERERRRAVVGGGLLNGNLGIALFFATAFWVTGDRAFRRDACRLLRMLDRPLGELPDPAAPGASTDLGLADGIGGTIYGLVALAAMLDEPAYVDKAEAVVRGIAPEAVTADRDFSLWGGTAGLAMGLAAFSRLSGFAAEIAAPAIRLCARHLLNAQSPHERGGACWLRPGRTDGLTGLVNGTAGIALALTELADFHRGQEMRAAAAAALAYERAMATAGGGCRDLRDRHGDPLHQYANGAAGVGLAMLRMRGRDTGASAAEIADLAATVAAAPTAPTDDLFCGNAGRLLFLHGVAGTFEDASLANVVDRALARCLAAAEDAGGFAWRGGDDTDNPCLFNGVAGLGLTLLHLSDPEWVPAFPALPTAFPSPRYRSGRRLPDLCSRPGPAVRGLCRGLDL